MSGNGAKLMALTKQVSSEWQRMKESWKDQKAREFERQYIEELLSSMDKAVSVMEQVDKLVAKIRSDCE